MSDTKDTPDAIMWVRDDGGRYAAGFRDPGSHAARAIAIASGRPYREIYERIEKLAEKERRSKRKRWYSDPDIQVRPATVHKLLDELGASWLPTFYIGSGAKVHVAMHELPMGRLVLNLKGHYAAVIDGVLHDLGHCRRDGARIVYGIWTLPEPEESTLER